MGNEPIGSEYLAIIFSASTWRMEPHAMTEPGPGELPEFLWFAGRLRLGWPRPVLGRSLHSGRWAFVRVA